MNLLQQTIKTSFTFLLVSLLSSCSDNGKEAEYTGILEHRPETSDGMWVIGGQSFSVSDEVKLDEDHGPLTVGTCVELEVEDGDVREIESEKMEKCRPEKQ
jgi:hypothetical protein